MSPDEAREKIKEDMAAFAAKGGRIQQVPMGTMGRLMMRDGKVRLDLAKLYDRKRRR